MKLGSWQEQLQGINELSIPAILQCYMTATHHDKTWYKAWHAWAYMNFQTVLFYKNHQQLQNMSEDQKAQVCKKKKSTISLYKISHILCFNILILN